MKEKLTFEQVLQICINQLNSVPIFVSQTETVGAQIRDVIRSLEACIEVMRGNTQETEEAEHGNADAE